MPLTGASVAGEGRRREGIGDEAEEKPEREKERVEEERVREDVIKKRSGSRAAKGFSYTGIKPCAKINGS